MPGLEQSCSHGLEPRRTVRIAVEAGPFGSERAGRILEKMTAGAGDAFEIKTQRRASLGGSKDPGSLIEALLAGEVDFAACAAESVPVTLPPGIRLEGALRARDPGYWLLAAPGCRGIDGLSDGSRVVACDAAARAQALFRRPSLRVEVATSEHALVTGMAHGTWDAAIVSTPAWEIPRLQLEKVPSAVILPPSGRGATALLVADGADPAEPWRRLLNEPDAEDCLLCERAFLARMASCTTGLCVAHAWRSGGRLELAGLIADPEGAWLVRACAGGPPSFGRILGLEVAESCRELASMRRALMTVTRPAPER